MKLLIQIVVGLMLYFKVRLQCPSPLGVRSSDRQRYDVRTRRRAHEPRAVRVGEHQCGGCGLDARRQEQGRLESTTALPCHGVRLFQQPVDQQPLGTYRTQRNRCCATISSPGGWMGLPWQTSTVDL